jgi:hypothetical protein
MNSPLELNSLFIRPCKLSKLTSLPTLQGKPKNLETDEDFPIPWA